MTGRLGIVLAAALTAVVTTATAALAAEVAIQDFEFRPQTVGVEVGGSVTWTNGDSAAHHATADDGAFDTGTLQPGDSATVTFEDPGTFPYFCEIHPFMQGEVQVGAQPIPGPTGSGTGSFGTAIAGGGQESLPQTATPLAVILVTGLAIVGAGLWLARRARPD